MELRTHKHDIRAEDSGDDNIRVITGYALRWNDTTDLSYSRDGSLIETFERGAFADTIRKDDIAMLIEHNGPAIASTQNKTLSLKEDKEGLAFSARLDIRDTEANNAYIRTDNGTSQGVSVGFVFGRDSSYEIEDTDTTTTMTISKVGRLYEISLVHFPAYTSSEVSARDFANARSLIEDTLALRQQQNQTMLLKAKILESEINL